MGKEKIIKILKKLVRQEIKITKSFGAYRGLPTKTNKEIDNLKQCLMFLEDLK